MESLYRTYRPLTFDDVVGQQHVVSTLMNAVTEGRISHAYLFCGPRGTGKTTMARILAKSLLCERAAADLDGAGAGEPVGCLPDGTCAECRAIAEGTHPDVYELDAASRTGVDNVREEIINSVDFAPVRGRYKIYIIDEVHMLSTAAFNALLKTLEEPPAHVVFVLCTTDPQKLPETILSRCQRFDFHRISNEDIVGRLRYVCGQEGFSYDEEALDIVARHARGGMRDALSTLEQLSVFGDGSVRTSDARSLLGEASSEVLSKFSRGIARRDTAGLFALVREQVDAGNDILELTRDLVAHMRDVYTADIAGDRPELFDIPAEEVRACAEEAELFEGTDRLARTLTVLDDAALEMRTASDPRLVLEIALTRLARPESDLTLESLAERVERLEAQVAGLSTASSPASGGPASGREQESEESRPEPAAERSRPPVPAARAASTAEQPRRSGAIAGSGSGASETGPTEHLAPATAPRPASAPAPHQESAKRRPEEGREPLRASGASRKKASAGQAPASADQQRRWAEVVSRVTQELPSRGALLQNAHIWSDDGERLIVWLPKGSGFAFNMLGRADARATIQPIVDEVFGHRSVKYVYEDDPLLRSDAGDWDAEGGSTMNDAVRPGDAEPAPRHDGPVSATAPASERAASSERSRHTSSADPHSSEQYPVAAPANPGRPAPGARADPSDVVPLDRTPAPASVPDVPAPVSEPVYEPVPYDDEDVDSFSDDEGLSDVDLPWDGDDLPAPVSPAGRASVSGPSGSASVRLQASGRSSDAAAPQVMSEPRADRSAAGAGGSAPAVPPSSPRSTEGRPTERSADDEEDVKSMLGDIFGAGTIFMDDDDTAE